MRGLLSLAAAAVVCAASPAAANWGYYGNPQNPTPANAYGGAAYAPAGYGFASSSFSGYGYGGYAYATLAQHGAAMPSWGDCPCCNNVWAGYCGEKAARAANRHCNSCGQTDRCGRCRHFSLNLGCRAKPCGSCNACNSCGSHRGCGCGHAEGSVESAPADANPADAPPPPAPEASASDSPPSEIPASEVSLGEVTESEAAAIEAGTFHAPTLPGIGWLKSVVSTRPQALPTLPAFPALPTPTLPTLKWPLR